jgi:hypothetical protein
MLRCGFEIHYSAIHLGGGIDRHVSTGYGLLLRSMNLFTFGACLFLFEAKSIAASQKHCKRNG